MTTRRPRLELITPAAGAQEAAAIVAAIEHFMRENAPAEGPLDQRSSRWARAAILESVQREEGFSSTWGDPSLCI
ncbi:MAG TPA: hypothetical protein VID48_08960 [Solirubrobacteraceae bacterium]|jgi:hypothetical protein